MSVQKALSGLKNKNWMTIADDVVDTLTEEEMRMMLSALTLGGQEDHHTFYRLLSHVDRGADIIREADEEA